MKKIRIQIALAIIGSCLLLSFVLSFISSRESLALLNEESRDKLKNLSSSYANEFGIEIKMIENTVKMLHSTVYTTFDIDRFESSPKDYQKTYFDFLDSIIYESTQTDNGIQGIYFTLNPELLNEWHEIWYADVEGLGEYEKYDMSVSDISEVNPDNEDYKYYFEPVSKMTGVWLSPYYDGLLEVYMISYVEPIVKDGVLIGIIGADLRMDDIARDIENMEIYSSGFALLLNQEHEILLQQSTQESKQEEDETLSSFLKTNQSLGKNGLMEYKSNGKESFFAFAQLPNKWFLVIQVPKEEVLEKAMHLRLTLIGITLGGVLLSSVLAFILSKILGTLIDKGQEKVRMTQERLFETEKIASLVYLVSGVAHEINTPVGNCITLSTYIEDQSKSTLEGLENRSLDKKGLQKTLESMEKASKHIYVNLKQTENIINSFKDLAKQKTTYIETRFNVRMVLMDMIANQIKMALPKVVEVDLTCDESIDLKGDINLFSQIFMNLMDNSLVHGFENRANGKITIDISSIENGILVEYKDNGSGINPYALDKIFVPFFSTKFGEKYKGLGMNVVYNIAKGAFQGSIQAKNIESGGFGVVMELYSANEDF